MTMVGTWATWVLWVLNTKSFVFFSGGSKQLLQGGEAVVFFSVIGQNVFITFFTDVLCLWALDLEMILEVFTMYSHSTTLWAWLHLFLACVNVFKGSAILVNTWTFGSFAFELECLQLLLSEPMHSSKGDSFISFAFFWAMLVLGSPWIKAFSAEERIAALALDGLMDNHGANGTGKVVGLLTSFFVRLDHIT